MSAEDYRVIEGDCVEQMRLLPEASVDAIVTDPPYGLEFMGKEWDSFKTYAGGNPNIKPQGKAIKDDEGAIGRTYGYRSKNPRCRRCGKLKRGNGCCKCPEPQWDTRTAESAFVFQCWSEDWAREAYRVLKPGGHLLAFGGSRTYHRLASAVEDAGFEIRDQMMWLYGSGFPKSLDVSKAIDKQRDDKADIYKVTAWVREARDAAGIGNKDIDEAFGANGMGRHWTDVPPHGKQPAVPTLEQVPQLLEVLGITPDEVPEEIRRLLLDLNGRKGQPGEAWFQREVTGTATDGAGNGSVIGLGSPKVMAKEYDLTAPATDEAKTWQGWGTALKPAHEPIVVARKPLIGTVAQNVLEHGTGALNIDGCRVETDEKWESGDRPNSKPLAGLAGGDGLNAQASGSHPQGRWPANVILDEEAGALLDAQSGTSKSAKGKQSYKRAETTAWKERGGSFTPGREWQAEGYGDQGGASRFFYCPKANKKERNAGLDGFAQSRQETLNGRTVKPCDQDQEATTQAASATQQKRATTEQSSTDGSKWSIDGSGSKSTDLSQPATKSTTSTGTSKTTASRTSPASMPSPTSVSTQAAKSETDNGGSPARSAKSSSRSAKKTGISPSKAGRSTADADPVTSSASSQTSAGAESSEKLPKGVVESAWKNTHP